MIFTSFKQFVFCCILVRTIVPWSKELYSGLRVTFAIVFKAQSSCSFKLHKSKPRILPEMREYFQQCRLERELENTIWQLLQGKKILIDQKQSSVIFWNNKLWITKRNVIISIPGLSHTRPSESVTQSVSPSTKYLDPLVQTNCKILYIPILHIIEDFDKTLTSCTSTFVFSVVLY